MRGDAFGTPPHTRQEPRSGDGEGWLNDARLHELRDQRRRIEHLSARHLDALQCFVTPESPGRPLSQLERAPVSLPTLERTQATHTGEFHATSTMAAIRSILRHPGVYFRYLRMQVQVYKAQHKDVPPGYPGGDVTAGATAADFVAQMTKPTNDVGVTNTTASSVFKYGPYLSAMPSNPLNNLTAVLTVADADAIPDPTNVDYGWIYKPLTGEIVANSTGSDASGTAYKNY